MPDVTPSDDQPKTLEELESQLDNQDLPASADAPPDPRAAGPMPSHPELPAEPTVEDDVLEEAGDAADQTDGEAGEGSKEDLTKSGLHLEANPNAPRPHFWRRKRFWFSVIFLLLLFTTLAWFIRPSRLAMVNALGLRVPLTITTGTVPESGQQSAVLKNVSITVNGAKATTDDKGQLAITTHYGQATIVASKPGYETQTQMVLLDPDPFFYLLGGKKQDDAAKAITFKLKAVGITLKFQAKDWLSDGPLTAGAFSVGDIVAKPNDQGVVQLVVPATDAKTLPVKSSLGGSYIDKTFDVPLDGTQPTISFVPAGKDYFVSNRSGGRAVYVCDFDGSNITEFIPASPIETSAMNFAVSPSGKFGVLASTRGNKRDSQNVLLQQLYIVDLSTKTMTVVDSSQWVNFVDWLGDTLVYTVGERVAGAASVTQRLASVNTATGKQTTLSTANSFGAVRVGIDSVVYQYNRDSSDPEADKNPELRTVLVKGGTEKNLGFQVQQLAQTAPDAFAYLTADGTWHEYNVSSSLNKNVSAPANPDRAYLATTSADGQNRLIVGSVDGNIALVVSRVANGQEKTLYSNAEVAGPVHFVGVGTIIFRQGSADYALSVNGGTPKKISDVSVPTRPVSPAGYFSLF